MATSDVLRPRSASYGPARTRRAPGGLLLLCGTVAKGVLKMASFVAAAIVFLPFYLASQQGEAPMVAPRVAATARRP